MIRYSCLPDDIESTDFVTSSLGAIFFLTLFLSAWSYYVSQKGDKAGVGFFRYFNVVYIVLTLILAIVSFTSVASIDSNDLIDEWAKLAERDKLHFENDIDELVSTNKVNASLHAIYNIILAILFALETCTMQSLYSALPENWARPVYSKISFQQGND